MMNKKRRKNAKLYNELLENEDRIITPSEHPHAYHVYHQYTIRIQPKLREKLIERFKKDGIGFGIYYPRGIHEQPVFRRIGYDVKLPVTERLSKEVISLPVHPHISEENIYYISDMVKHTLRNLL